MALGSHRQSDSKGRVTLGEAFANRTFIIREEGGSLILEPARVIPEREAWIYENERAIASVRRGLAEAKARKFAAAPDLERAKKIADKIRE